MKMLVIVARGLQAGAVGCYGNQWIDTPALNRLAAEGIVFDQHFADAASPEGARQAWRTGRYHLPAPGMVPAPDSADLLDLLKSQAIPTVLVLDDSRPSPPDVERGWQQVQRVTAADPEDTALETTLSTVQARLEEFAEESNWLVWVELATLLPPWEVPADFQDPYFSDEPLEEEEEEAELEEEDAEFAEDEEIERLTPLNQPEPGMIDPLDDTLFLRLQTTYGSAVSYLDAGIGQLLEVLDDLEIANETLVVVVSDCGQSLGEHGVVGPVRPWLHEETIHLPLLVRLPGKAEGGRRIFALTQAVDLAPTLAEAFGLPPLACQGHSLLPLIHGKVEQVRDYLGTAGQVGEGIEWCLRTPDWAYLLPVQTQPDDTARIPQLYVKPDDRCEVNNVRQQRLEWSEQLEQTLRAFVEATQNPGPFQPPALPDEEEGNHEPQEDTKKTKRQDEI